MGVRRYQLSNLIIFRTPSPRGAILWSLINAQKILRSCGQCPDRATSGHSLRPARTKYARHISA